MAGVTPHGCGEGKMLELKIEEEGLLGIYAEKGMPTFDLQALAFLCDRSR